MTMRKTPNMRIRYPWASDVASAADVQAMASDIDQALEQTATLGANFSRFASVVASRAAVQSIPKGALTAITFDTVPLNNGANSPLANGSWWNPANPTRLTAPTACVVLAAGFGGINFGAALTSTNCLQVTIALNGASFRPGVQGGKYSLTSTSSGQQWYSALSMWKLNAGDYLELKMYWTGSPAGPYNTDNVQPPTLAVAMVGLPTVS